ncbi:helix-turn-helix domain-containing protein [uncultured Actinomyces sp.]|uniref:TetR/AcrR family transcriptional regulator n=1 Tax=uncultured Actinomyces sp. TaxID=249061 RepID=UPI00288A1548|nr:helix-turn-helix domain-containing protein [uncultured Actinomyces sp.]
MTRTRAGRPYHIGLTPEAIIDVAVEATRDAGLESWSVRDLARRLDVATASLYHHVGGQELLRRSVVERVLTMVGFPTQVLPWRKWFRAALFPARPVLAGHPGTAR